MTVFHYMGTYKPPSIAITMSDLQHQHITLYNRPVLIEITMDAL